MVEREGSMSPQAARAFFGRVLAGQSHEITNVLNIIHELVGLEEDILEAGAQGRAVDVDKLAESVGKIRRQLDRGQSLVRLVNGFAHSVDVAVGVCDLQEVLSQTLLLVEREARLAKTVVALDDGCEPLSVEGSRFDLIRAIYTCIEIALSASGEGRRVAVGYTSQDGVAAFTVTSADAISVSPAVSEKLAHLRSIVSELGGRVTIAPPEEGGRRLAFTAPLRRSDGVVDSVGGGDRAPEAPQTG